MGVLNLRNFPEDLKQRLRIGAAQSGEKLHQHAIRLLEQASGLRAEDPDSVVAHVRRVTEPGGAQKMEIEIT